MHGCFACNTLLRGVPLQQAAASQLISLVLANPAVLLCFFITCWGFFRTACSKNRFSFSLFWGGSSRLKGNWLLMKSSEILRLAKHVFIWDWQGGKLTFWWPDFSDPVHLVNFRLQVSVCIFCGISSAKCHQPQSRKNNNMTVCVNFEFGLRHNLYFCFSLALLSFLSLFISHPFLWCCAMISATTSATLSFLLNLWSTFPVANSIELLYSHVCLFFSSFFFAQHPGEFLGKPGGWPLSI